MGLDAYDNYAWRIIVVTTLCLVVSVVVVGLRFYVRWVIIRNLGRDDWFLAAALVVYIGVATLTAACTKFGLGRHIDTLSIQKRSLFLKLIWAASIGYGAVIVLIKMAFLFQYRRVFPLRNFQHICDLFLVLIVIWAVGGTMGAGLCGPNGFLVCYGDLTRPHRCGHLHFTSTIVEDAASTKISEGKSNGDLLSGLLHMCHLHYPPYYAPSIDLERRSDMDDAKHSDMVRL
ncbi:integral membrane [Pyrenophora seminiperda CCB06]|uniref:Integral membrane n=1 Tax=Pyrenophora seminiperda CCB06 TaxID=1302712 RepID=A0A3M7MFT7_9PLEO|nr:integral membrane [Pyrenophora seminiperda CCB06]